MRPLRKTRTSLGILVAWLVCACGDGGSGEGCPTHPDPTFELGAGEERFVPLTDGADLQMLRGDQGGCHFALAFRTDGFLGLETFVLYRLDNETDGEEIIVSQQFVRLRSAPEEGRCQTVNFIAFLPAPGTLANDRVRIQATLEEENGSDTRAVEVVARLDREGLCGER